MEQTLTESKELQSFLARADMLFHGAGAKTNGSLTNSSSVTQSHWSSIRKVIESFRELEEDWDGLGAKAPSEEIIRSAEFLVQSLRHGGLPAPSRVVPGLEGAVIFEWQDQSTYLEIEVSKPNCAEVMIVVGDGPAEHRTMAF